MVHQVLDLSDFEKPAAQKRRDEIVAVVGLGYVGLPLAVALARKFQSVIGFDSSAERVVALTDGHDDNDEVTSLDLSNTSLEVSHLSGALSTATTYIVAVPTPINEFKQPDLSRLDAACATIGRYLTPGDLVIFESTVYPGVTEGHCVPLLEEFSGLEHLRDFNVAYSPERINPGDKTNRLETIAKLISADTDIALERVRSIYADIISADLFACTSIKVAEAAKALENTQRDVNIALMNEMSALFEKIGIQTGDVLKAAQTKWNFLPFTPGLVGGHCISVDPHYLRALSEREGLVPSLIENARRVNDAVPRRVLDRCLRHIATLGRRARIAQVGLTFKPDVPDLRNSLALTLAKDLQNLGLDMACCDPVLEGANLLPADLNCISIDQLMNIDILIIAVPHREVIGATDLSGILTAQSLIVDIQNCLDGRVLPQGTVRWAL